MVTTSTLTPPTRAVSSPSVEYLPTTSGGYLGLHFSQSSGGVESNHIKSSLRLKADLIFINVVTLLSDGKKKPSQKLNRLS